MSPLAPTHRPSRAIPTMFAISAAPACVRDAARTRVAPAKRSRATSVVVASARATSGDVTLDRRQFVRSFALAAATLGVSAPREVR